MMGMTDKVCTQCKKEKPITDFWVKAYGLGLMSQCKICAGNKRRCREKQRAKHPKRVVKKTDAALFNSMNIKW